MFNSLFKKTRKKDGKQLSFFDDLNSISHVNEVPSILSDGFLGEKPLILRVLFHFLFKHYPPRQNKHAIGVLEQMIDQKTQKTDEFNQVSCLESHEELPIIFLGQNERFYIVSKKTLATLYSFGHKNMKKIKYIIPDSLGYKILLIDHNKNAFVVKYDLSFTEIELIYKIEGMNIYNAAWFDNSTKIFFSTTSAKILILDFIEF